MHDAFLHSVLEMASGGAAAPRYTLVLTSSPIGAPGDRKAKAGEEGGKGAAAEGAEGKPALELRSVPVATVEAATKNQTAIEGGLFHRYQFFTPAIFMGYIAFIVMIAILYVPSPPPFFYFLFFLPSPPSPPFTDVVG